MSDASAKNQPTMASVHGMLKEFQQVMEERVREETERARRGSRTLAVLALALACLAIGSTAGLLYFAFYQDLPLLTSPSIRAHEIVLVDGAGTERGSWTVDPEGTARLRLVDPDGVERLKLTVRADGEQGISLADGTGTNRVVLGHLADRSSTLAFADDTGVTRAVLGMSPAGASSLLFADAHGGARAALGLSPNGEPTFWWPELFEDGDGSSGSP
jgi:hypothetical protein